MTDDTFFDNKDALLSHGNVRLRSDVLRIVEKGVRRAIPYDLARKMLSCSDDGVHVDESFFPLGKGGSIYVVGVGKGAYPIALALDEALGARIRRGVVVVKEGEKRRLQNIDVFESSHPIPDERSVVGARKMVEILESAKEGDLVFAAITGGSSALVNLPADGVTIEDLGAVNRMLLGSGADIGQMNAVRKHLCMMKGGRVVQYGQPATVITLTLDTAPPDMPWPDMSLPDPTTFGDAIAMLKAYSLWDKVPASVRARLETGTRDPSLETLKTLDGMKCALFGIASPAAACEAAAEEAARLGYEPHILSSAISGEAKDVGIVMAGMTNEIVKRGRPFKAPCALISGGETTVTLNGAAGEGGPNQETALGFVSKLHYGDGAAFASIDTDGTDGPCDIAGGLVDGFTAGRMKELGIDLNSVFLTHSSSAAFRKLGDTLLTGHTGTNVMNLRVVLISATEK